MKRMALGLAPRGLGSLFRDGVSTGLSDKELLERFATGRDSAGELAFATLVARHGPMVLSVCRRMLRDPHESEDAFQATFLVLIRKRSGIRIDESLGPWLYGVSVRVARRARTLASRRRWIELDEAIGGPARATDSVRPRAAIRDRRLPDQAAEELPRGDRAVLPGRADARRGCRAPALSGRHRSQSPRSGPGHSERAVQSGGPWPRCEQAGRDRGARSTKYPRRQCSFLHWLTRPHAWRPGSRPVSL